MSVEAFFGVREDTLGLREGVLSRQRSDRREGKVRSPVATLAQQIVEAGQVSLRTLGEDYSRGRIKWNEFRSAIRHDYLGVVFGNAILGLEEALVNGRFSFNDFIARGNLAVYGTPIPNFQAPADVVSEEVFTRVQHKNMIALAREDPTLAIFFKQRENLPANLKRFIDTNQWWPLIDGMTFHYKRLADAVLERPPMKITQALTVVPKPGALVERVS